MSGPLFVTRRFPPSVGGMETLAAEVWEAIGDVPGARLLAHRGTGRGLIRWLPKAGINTRLAIARGQVDTLLLGDGVVAAALLPILGRRRPRTVTMVMGSDLTYRRAGYPSLLRRALDRSDLVLAISQSTADLAVGLGVDQARVVIVRLGTSAPHVDPDQRIRCRASLDELTGGATAGRPLVGTLGRLIERKGSRWFVGAVLPELPEVHYLIVGRGPEGPAIEAAARQAGVSDRVHLLGVVDDRQREVVFGGLDLFVQPNVRVAGDAEGFGLVTIEAAMRGTPVVASDLEGLTDAVVDGKTGVLLPPEDPETWTTSLRDLLSDPESLLASGQEWGDETRRLYGTAQFRAAIRDAVGLEASADC